MLLVLDWAQPRLERLRALLPFAMVGAHWLTDVVGSLAMAGVIAAVVLATHAILRPSE